MALHILAVVAGLVLLVVGADRFVDGAAALARRSGLSPLLVGILIIGFGTSAPELLVSANASLRGTSGLALGNAYGSNIGNILLILGVTALLRTVRVSRSAIRLELPMLLTVTALAAVLVLDGTISRGDSAILLLALALSLALSIRQALRHPEPTDTPADVQGEHQPRLTARHSSAYLVIGLAGMLLGSELLVRGASAIAEAFGVSDLVIGLTVVSIGTSLPELASSVVAASKGEDELVLGNILGSNTINTLGVVGIAGLIRPLRASPDLVRRDLPVMVGATILLYIFCRGRGKAAGIISRPEGAVLLLGYAVYLAVLLAMFAGG